MPPAVIHLICGDNSDDRDNDTNTRSYQLLTTHHVLSTSTMSFLYFYCSTAFNIGIIIPILRMRKLRSREVHMAHKFWSQDNLNPGQCLEDKLTSKIILSHDAMFSLFVHLGKTGQAQLCVVQTGHFTK